MSDFYEILGVSKTASDDEIKLARRNLAKQLHPDQNQGNKESEDKLKAVNEAYDTLINPQKRAAYDMQLKYGSHHNDFDNNPFRQSTNFGFNFGGSNFNNVDDLINQFFEQAGMGGPFRQANRPPKNRDIHLTIELPLEDVFTGKELPISFDYQGNKISLSAKIPAGIANGAKIRFPGHGDKSNPAIQAGDLYITVNIKPHARFVRENENLYVELQIDALEAIVGKSVEIDCIDGTRVSLNIPASTQPGVIFKLNNKGMPIMQQLDRYGSLFVKIKIVIPTNLSPAQISSILKIVNSRKSTIKNKK